MHSLAEGRKGGGRGGQSSSSHRDGDVLLEGRAAIAFREAVDCDDDDDGDGDDDDDGDAEAADRAASTAAHHPGTMGRQASP